MSFIPVTDITGFEPTQAIVGEETKLEGTVQPPDATNKNIVWSVVSGNATIVTKVDGQYIKPNASGTITVRATIIDGKLQ
jgi:endo-1,4-beta-xylanase